MYNKIKLYFQIRRFYEIFGEVLGANPCAKWSDMTNDNVHDVLFDINEALSGYESYENLPMYTWLRKLSRQIRTYSEPKPQILSTIVATIGIMFTLWCVASTFEVASKNDKPNPQYSPMNIWVMLFAEDEPEVEDNSHTRYTAYGRYYTNGTVITNDGNEWAYSADTISDKTPTDDMPVWIGFDDNGTPDSIEDDIILGLVYDRNTAVYDELETALGDKFELERDGNNIHIGGIK